MSAGLLERLEDGVLLLDGGMGSLLIAMGLEAGRASEAWTIEEPQRVVEAHRAYVEAGSDVLHTNTFGATPPKLAAAGLDGRCRELNAAAVALARRAAGAAALRSPAFGGTLVAGDVGPTGKLLPPVGDASEAWLRDAFREQTAALASAGVDLISIETMFDLREALAAVAAARETGLPVMASMTFEARPRGHFTIMGDRLVDSLAALAEAGAAVVGMNCSAVSGEMLVMVREAAAALVPLRPSGATGVPLAAQPNAGRPRATAEGVAYDDASPETFSRDLLAMVDAGARVVGGCCGTDPGFIRRARRALDERRACERTPARGAS